MQNNWKGQRQGKREIGRDRERETRDRDRDRMQMERAITFLNIVCSLI